MIDLSLLICSTHTRWETFGRAIQKQVWDQLASLPPEDQDRIEIIMVTDNKKIMLGEKRNVMVDMAQGRYVQFIDDDDRIEPDMFRLVLNATKENCDVIVFDVSVSLNGEAPKVCRYSIGFDEDRNFDDHYERLPNHICVVKRELARQVSFPNKVYGEDADYARLLKPLLGSQYSIEKVLYHYDWSENSSETQEWRPASKRVRKVQPIVDVVMLSKASTPELQSMTQVAVDSCLAGANSLPVNIMVIEQQPGVRYDNARTIFAGDEFNYNRFANRGAAMGFAPWLMITNNDVYFHDGWLHQLLLANHEVVSPKCPHDTRSAHITENETGYENAVHFSGWCFMMRREIWHRIGQFDDCVTYWCSDDVVIEQLRAIGVTPMKVPTSVVEHKISATLDPRMAPAEYTWANVKIFNDKYDQNKFADWSLYQDWLVESEKQKETTQ